jgi:hypothetical protein
VIRHLRAALLRAARSAATWYARAFAIRRNGETIGYMAFRSRWFYVARPDGAAPTGTAGAQAGPLLPSEQDAGGFDAGLSQRV